MFGDTTDLYGQGREMRLDKREIELHRREQVLNRREEQVNLRAQQVSERERRAGTTARLLDERDWNLTIMGRASRRSFWISIGVIAFNVASIIANAIRFSGG